MTFKSLSQFVEDQVQENQPNESAFEQMLSPSELEKLVSSVYHTILAIEDNDPLRKEAVNLVSISFFGLLCRLTKKVSSSVRNTEHCVDFKRLPCR